MISNMHLEEPVADEITLAAVMAALSDPVRVAIVRELAARGESTCGAFELGVSKATRSHHFKVLREAGLTHTRAEGTHRHVSLRRDEVDARFPGLLGAVLAAAEREAGAYRGPFLIAELAILHERRAASCRRWPGSRRRTPRSFHAIDGGEHERAAAERDVAALAAVGQRRPCAGRTACRPSWR